MISRNLFKGTSNKLEGILSRRLKKRLADRKPELNGDLGYVYLHKHQKMRTILFNNNYQILLLTWTSLQHFKRELCSMEIIAMPNRNLNY